MTKFKVNEKVSYHGFNAIVSSVESTVVYKIVLDDGSSVKVYESDLTSIDSEEDNILSPA
jgi:hypothetical protein